MSNSDAFRRMADAIDHNADRPFGGAMVIVIPPSKEGADPVVWETLILDSAESAAQFLGLIKAKATVMANDLDMAERQSAAGWQ